MSQPTNFSVTTTKSPAPSPVSPSAGAGQVAQTPQARERTISPPTTFNTETGLREDVPGGWSGKDGEKPAKPAKEAATKPTAPKETRHEKWLADQKAAREQREGKKTAKAAESQALARDFLKKGDLVGAAKSLGMSPSEFREYAQNVLLTVPTPDAELTPEQKKEKDEQAFREEVKAFKSEQEQFRSATIRAGYIKDKVMPAIADAAKFEFIHTEGADKVAAYIYDFMNAHYGKTREELSASDVAEEIEKQLEANFVASVEKARKMKKAARYFREEEPAVEATAEAEPEPALAQAAEEPAREEEDELEAHPLPRPVVRREPGARIPFALLSRAEKQAIIDEENRAARRA